MKTSLAKGAQRVVALRGLADIAAKIADGSLRPLSIDEMAKTFGIKRSEARLATRMATRTAEVGGQRVTVIERIRQLAQSPRQTAVETLVREFGMKRAEADTMLRISSTRGLAERLEAIGRGDYRMLTRGALAREFGLGRGDVRVALQVARNVAMLAQLGRIAEGGARPTVESLVRDHGFTPADARALLRAADNAALVTKLGEIARGTVRMPTAPELAAEFRIDLGLAQWSLRTAGGTALALDIAMRPAGSVQTMRVGQKAGEFGISRGDVRRTLRAMWNPELAQQFGVSAHSAGDSIAPPPAASGDGAPGADMPVRLGGDGPGAAGTGDGPAAPDAGDGPATPPAPGGGDGTLPPVPPRGGAGGGPHKPGGGDGDTPPPGGHGQSGGPPEPGGDGSPNTTGLGVDPNPVTGTASGVPPPAPRTKPLSARKLARAMQNLTVRPIEAAARKIRTGLFRKRMTVDELRQQIAHRRQLQQEKGEHQDYDLVEYSYGGERLVFVEHRPAAPTSVRRNGSLSTVGKLWRQALTDKALAEAKAGFLQRRLAGAADGERAPIAHAIRAARSRAHQLGDELKAFHKHAPQIEETLKPYLDKITDIETLLTEWMNHPRRYEDLVTKLRDPAQRDRVLGELDDVQRCALVCEANRRTHGETPRDVQIAAVLALDSVPTGGGGLRAFLGLRSELPRGVVVQMLTGEGKTLVGRVWALTRALAGDDVAVITHNSTLAGSGAARAKAVADELGITTAFREPGRNTQPGAGAHEPDGFHGTPEAPANLSAIYDATVVYGSARELVSDWQRGKHDPRLRFDSRHVLMDEVDMLAIDWGRTAYRLGEQATGTVDNAAAMYAIADLARSFQKHGTYDVVDGRVRISREQAKEFAEKVGLGGELAPRHVAEIADALTSGWHHRYNRDYFRSGDSAVVVDRDNGEAVPDNRWFDHGWIDALEGVTIKPPLRTVSEETLLQYLQAQRSYRGVTGTAKSAADALRKVYGLEVVEIATNDPRRLANLPRRVFTDAAAQGRNVAEEILEAHRRGDMRPVLILMRDIADTLTFAKMLKQVLATGPHPVEPRVVNALTPRRLYEAVAEAEAGRPFAVTVATARFGRGTDISLGGYAPRGAPHPVRDLLIAKGGGHVEIVSMFGTQRAAFQGGGRFGRNGQPGTWRESLSLDDPQLAAFANRHLLRFLKKHSTGELTGWRLRVANRMINKAQLRADKLRGTQLALTVEGKLRPDNVSEQVVGTTADGRLGEAARAVQEADLRVAQALRDFERSGGLDKGGLPARLAELEQVCSELCAAEHALVTAQEAFREQLALARPRVLTLPAEPAVAEPGTPAATDVEGERTLGLTRAAVGRAREQITAGDLPGAIATLQGIGQDALDVAGAAGRVGCGRVDRGRGAAPGLAAPARRADPAARRPEPSQGRAEQPRLPGPARGTRGHPARRDRGQGRRRDRRPGAGGPRSAGRPGGRVGPARRRGRRRPAGHRRRGPTPPAGPADRQQRPRAGAGGPRGARRTWGAVRRGPAHADRRRPLGRPRRTGGRDRHVRREARSGLDEVREAAVPRGAAGAARGARRRAGGAARRVRAGLARVAGAPGHGRRAATPGGGARRRPPAVDAAGVAGRGRRTDQGGPRARVRVRRAHPQRQAGRLHQGHGVVGRAAGPDPGDRLAAGRRGDRGRGNGRGRCARAARRDGRGGVHGGCRGRRGGRARGRCLPLRAPGPRAAVAACELRRRCRGVGRRPRDGRCRPVRRRGGGGRSVGEQRRDPGAAGRARRGAQARCGGRRSCGRGRAGRQRRARGEGRGPGPGAA
ncbi:hypothetical protein BJF90_30765 [Pseudonocardia sp. CNS-004]|nr:hypothetical protein BJF90_30765 [Pseudonocardia sp. CNS-004]